MVHPHRIKITGFGSGQSALHCVGLGTYLDIAICPGILVQKEKIDRLDGALVNGFVVGVHFEMESEVACIIKDMIGTFRYLLECGDNEFGNGILF